MSDKLIEAVAEAIANLSETYCKSFIEEARAAIAAIEASGTHRVVPVEPTEAMKNALAVHLFHIEPEPTYAAMLAAAPKEGE